MATTRYRKWAGLVFLMAICWRNGDLVLGLAIDPVGDPCSAVWPGAQYHDKYCYKVIEDKIQWHQLENHCPMTKCSAEPAQPMTSEALQFVQNLAMMTSADAEKSSLNVWLGANRNTSTHPLRWTCTNQEVDRDILWFDQDKVPQGNDCLVLQGTVRKPEIENCLEEGYAMCQMRFGNPCEHAYTPDAVPYLDLCFKYHGQKVTLDEAQATCEMEGATLADITSFTQFQLLKRLDSEMNGGESILIIPHTTEPFQPEVSIPVTGLVKFVISACGGFIMTLTYNTETTEEWRDMVRCRFQRNADSHTDVILELCMLDTEDCIVSSQTSLPVKMRCEDWWRITLKWGNNTLKFAVNDTDLDLEQPDYKGTFAMDTLKFRSNGDGPGFIRYTASGYTGSPSTWLGTYRDSDDGVLRWSSTTEPVQLDEDLYNLNLYETSGLLFMGGIGRELKASANSDDRKSFICQKRILENTHFMVIAPSDVNKTLAITTEVKVAIMVSIVDLIGILSMSVSTSWLTKGYPMTMKLSDTADVFKDSGDGPEDTTRTLTVFSTHPSIAVTLFSTDQDDDDNNNNNNNNNKTTPVLPLDLLSHIYLVTTLAKYGMIEIMAIMEGETIVNFNCSHYTNLWVFLEDNIIRDPKSGVIPMYYTEKVLMELHSDRIWLRIEASQPISLLTSEDGQMVSILPEQEATSQYASVPSYPLSSSSDDTFTILALEDDLVKENGTSLFTTLTADDMQVVTMESGSYHTITSTNNVYITKLDEDNEPVGTCSVSNQEYDQIRATHEIVVSSSETGDVITLLAIVEDHMASTMLLNDEPEMMKCETISNSSSIGCRTEIQPGFYTLTSTTAEAFQAYVTDSNLDGLFCQYMGSSPNTNTRKKRAVSDGTDKPYRTEVYITAPPQPTQGTAAPTPEEEEDCQRLGTCPKPIDPRKFLNVSVGELVKIIRNDLAVDEKETSAYKRKKISIPDHRFSSKAIGSAGVVFVAFAIGVVVFLDCMKLARVMSNVDVVPELKKDVRA